MLRNNASARNRLAMVSTVVVILLGSFGCASQNWVIDTVREMDKDLVARVEKIEATAAAEKIRVDAAAAAERTRVEAAAAAEKTRVDQQLTEVRGIGTDARNRADAVDGRVTRALANRLKRTQVQQADVVFETGKSVLHESDRAALLGILKVLADNPTYTADIVGYTDTVGKADLNVTLSWQREEAVRRFMVERGVAVNRLFFIGVGEELSGHDAQDAAKREKNRRVTITIFKPED